MLQLVALFPHPPIVVLEVGGQETRKVKKTFEAMKKLAEEIAVLNPEVIVIVTPHGHVFRDAITITDVATLTGDLVSFGAPQVKVEFPLATESVAAIIETCQEAPFPCVALDKELLQKMKLSLKLDHGQVVPLSFLAKAGWQGKLVPVNMGVLPYEELYDLGQKIYQAMEKVGQKWVFLISGDLSHCLSPDAPGGFSPQGAVFDQAMRQLVKEKDVLKLIQLNPESIEEAGECGLRPLIIGLGALDGWEIEAEELSYEGPFGVGYLVARFKPLLKNPTRIIRERLYDLRKDKLIAKQQRESTLVKLARLSIKHYLTKGTIIKQKDPLVQEIVNQDKNIQSILVKSAGAFVSIKKHEELRGCIGTIEPAQENLLQEIIHNAVSAAIHDPRFDPVDIDELYDITISVDVLAQPEPIKNLRQLDPEKYGVIVKKGNRKGLLLPDLPGVNSVEEQVRIAKEKAGIRPDEDVTLERFLVTRFI